MPGYGCLCGGCNNCLEAQGYDLDRLSALDAGMDDGVLDEWLADADKIAHYTSYFDETNWKVIEQRVALGDGAALLAEFRAQLRDVMTDDAKDEATARYKAERLNREMP